MEFLVGLTLALGVSLGGTVAGLDRERAFYNAVALAVGTYYILCAVMGGSSEALIREMAAFAVLASVAVVGFRRNFWLVVVALAGHGLFDVFHGHLIVNEGVPAYWPMPASTPRRLRSRRFEQISDKIEGVILATELIRGQRRPTSIVMRITPTIATKWLLPRLSHFLDLMPDVSIRIDGSNEPVRSLEDCP